MKSTILKKFIPHLIAIAIALVIIIAYFNPMLSGKVLKQHDVEQWRASYEEIHQFQTTTGERTFWTNTIFSGMPTYLIGASFYNNFTVKVQAFIASVLPNPLDTVFLLFICFYILLLTFDLSPILAFVGAIAFTFSSFNVINIDAGHMTKGNAIAYMPLVLAGIQITLRKNRLFGSLLTGIALSLQLSAGHLQITYYLLLLILVWMIAEVFMSVKEKRIVPLLTCGIFLSIAAILGVATNATSLMATEEYGKYSIRGQSELTKTAVGSSNEDNASSGLDKDYALQYSFTPIEPLTILIPNLYGGAQYGELSTSSETYAILKKNQIPNAKQIVQSMPLYWGNQPFTAGPTYYGAIICFLFVLGLVLVKGNEKWWILAVSILAICLSMGKYFMPLTNLFFYHFPLYNKFRSVTFILAITQITFPLLGLIALRDIVKGKCTVLEIKKALLLSFYIVGGLCAIFVLMPDLLFSLSGMEKLESIDDYFVSRADAQFPEWLRSSIIADRKSLLRMDAIRSLILIGLSVGVIWIFIVGKINQLYLSVILTGLIVFDLWQVDKRFLNEKDYQVKKKVTQAIFPKTATDEIILQDKDPNYKVYNTTQNLTQDAMTSYYHKSIGGYHGAKLRRYQELIEFQIAKNNMEIFNMLNVKYFIVGDSANNLYPQLNPSACGNAWFVPQVTLVENADAEIDSLSNIDPKKTVFIDKRFANQLEGFIPNVDTSASIKLKTYAPNKLKYESNTSSQQVAVFSEIYYEKGWNAYVDGVMQSHFRCNYVLRGMLVPAGKHTIEFKFEPSVIAIGEKISLVSSLLLYGGLLIIGGMGFIKMKKEEDKS
jgi:hypothetical protein